MANELPNKLYALTILGCRREGMDEKEYHSYVSEKHAPCLKELLARNGIVDYTIQHNASEERKLMDRIFPPNHKPAMPEYDAIITISFRDVQDYLNVLDDEHFKNVVMPDHVNFADPARTQMTTGWYQRHV